MCEQFEALHGRARFAALVTTSMKTFTWLKTLWAKTERRLWRLARWVIANQTYTTQNKAIRNRPVNAIMNLARMLIPRLSHQVPQLTSISSLTSILNLPITRCKLTRIIQMPLETNLLLISYFIWLIKHTKRKSSQNHNLQHQSQVRTKSVRKWQALTGSLAHSLHSRNLQPKLFQPHPIWRLVENSTSLSKPKA